MATYTKLVQYRSVRDKQKRKLNLRRYIRKLPSHQKLTKWDKLYRKRAFQRRAENDK